MKNRPFAVCCGETGGFFGKNKGFVEKVIWGYF